METEFVSAFNWKALDDIKKVPFGSLVVREGKWFRHQQGGFVSLGDSVLVDCDAPTDMLSANYYWSVAPPIMEDLEVPHACDICSQDTTNQLYMPNTSCSLTRPPFYPVCDNPSCLGALETMLIQSEHHHLFSFTHNVKGLVVRHDQATGAINYDTGSSASDDTPQLCVDGVWVSLALLREQNAHLSEKFECTLTYPYAHHHKSILGLWTHSERLRKQQWMEFGKLLSDAPFPLASVYPHILPDANGEKPSFEEFMQSNDPGLISEVD